MSDSICLIGGTGRSGTTVLCRALARHPDVTDVPEWRFLVDPDGLCDFYHASAAWTPYCYDERLRRLRSMLRRMRRRRWWDLAGLAAERYLGATGWSRRLTGRYKDVALESVSPDFPRLSRELVSDLGEFTFHGSWTGTRFGARNTMVYAPPDRERVRCAIAGFLSAVMADVCQHQGATVYLEKNTWNILWFDVIRELMPTARLVHIHRDPRDVAASFTGQTWMPSDPLKSARIVRDLIVRWWTIRERVPAESWLEVSLESLVGDTEATMRRIADFYGLPWHDALLTHDLSRGNHGRWRQDIPADRHESVNDILRDVLEHYGYR